MQITMAAISLNSLTGRPTGLFPNVGKYVHDLMQDRLYEN